MTKEDAQNKDPSQSNQFNINRLNEKQKALTPVPPPTKNIASSKSVITNPQAWSTDKDLPTVPLNGTKFIFRDGNYFCKLPRCGGMMIPKEISGIKGQSNLRQIYHCEVKSGHYKGFRELGEPEDANKPYTDFSHPK